MSRSFDADDTCEYYPLPEQYVKIVLCKTEENVPINKLITSEPQRPQDALNALSDGNIKAFGTMLTTESEMIFKRSKRVCGKTHGLFEIARAMKDAEGIGVLRDGGIFAVVKNESVDAFMHDVGAEYEKTMGKRPKFYVTKPENSGAEVKPVG